VTHSRKTIAMGDTLYGVTMQEKGISKLVSVKFTELDTPNNQAKPASAVVFKTIVDPFIGKISYFNQRKRNCNKYISKRHSQTYSC